MVDFHLPIRLPPVQVSWTKRDALLFANTIGCRAEHLQYLYELHPDFTALPTYPIVLTFKHACQGVIDFRKHFDRFINVNIAGIPRLDSTRVVDGGRTLSVIKQCPASSEGRIFKLRTLVTDVVDKGKAGTIVSLQHTLYEEYKDGSKAPYTETTEVAFYVGQGGWGGPKGNPVAKISTPDETPLVCIHHRIPTTAHLLYRLNGDYNPLHVDTVAAKRSGQDGVIMHGLYSWNVTCYELLAIFANADATNLKQFEGRFLAPVVPGDQLVIEGWLTAEDHSTGKLANEEALQEVVYKVSIKDRSVCLIGKAIFSRTTMMKSKLKL